MKKFISLLLLALISGLSFGQSFKSELVKVNGIDMYYEVYGEGEPLLLLHGWTQSSSFWSDFIPTYTPHFKVYAVDLRGHGRTSQVTSDFTLKKASEDILALLDHLKLKKVKAIGLSYGALTLLELTSSNSEKLESMILIGTSHDYKGGENSDGNTTFSYDNLPISFIDALKEIHYHGESQIKALFDPNLNFQIKLDEKALNEIKTRTLIIHGDRDEILGVDPAFALYKNLPNSALWVVPNTGHIAITGPNQEQFLATSLQFLTMKNKERTATNKN